MRILLFSHGYPPTVSGVTRVVQKLARVLVRHGHQVAVVAASDVGRGYRSRDEGVRLIRVRSIDNPVWSEGRVPVPTRRSLHQIIRSFRPDIIHTHENAVLGTQLIRLRKELDVPLLASCHLLPTFLTQFVRRGGLRESWLLKNMWRYMVWHLNQYDAVVFPTQAHRDQYLDHGLEARPVVISNGVDTRRYHPRNGDREDVDGRYGLPAGPRILFVGRLCKDKNLETLIQAMPQIWAGGRAHLLLVGRGDERPALESLVAEMGLEHCVRLLGYVPEEDLPAIYRAVDLFAITSRVEVQSIPTLQALVSGLPVVAADSGALPELVQQGRNGFLIPPDDPQAVGRAILDVLEAPELAREMGQASMAIGREHDELGTFQAFINLYRQMTASRWTWSPQPIWSEALAREAGHRRKRLPRESAPGRHAAGRLRQPLSLPPRWLEAWRRSLARDGQTLLP